MPTSPSGYGKSPGFSKSKAPVCIASERICTPPRRFNPAQEAWLPVLHTQRWTHHYTVLYSNTARAHQLGKTHDWVNLYYDRDVGDGQCTVITSERGPMKGCRIVRGREDECLEYYQGHTGAEAVDAAGSQ